MAELERLDDGVLVERASQGERAAFEALYARHRGWVLALAWRFTGFEADALDVLQETFAYFFSRFPGFTLTGSLRAYLYPVIRHQAADLHRRRRKVVSLEAEREAGRAPERAAHPPEPTMDLEVRLAILSEGHREVVRLRFVAGLKIAEIAEVMGLPPGTVKSRLHHALSRLREREEAERMALEAPDDDTGPAAPTEGEPSSAPERLE